MSLDATNLCVCTYTRNEFIKQGAFAGQLLQSWGTATGRGDNTYDRWQRAHIRQVAESAHREDRWQRAHREKTDGRECTQRRQMAENT